MPRLTPVWLLLALGVCAGCEDGKDGKGAPVGEEGRTEVDDGGTAPGTDGGAVIGSTVIGAAGGTVRGPDGAEIVIPAGALTTDTAIAIEQSSVGAPPLSVGLTPIGPMYAFTPHGTTFRVPVTVTLPFDSASVPKGKTPSFYKTTARDRWERIENATFDDDHVAAQITSFSNGQVAVPSVVAGVPVREWGFGAYPGNGGAEQSFGEDTQVGGELQEVVDFGSGTDIEIRTFHETIPQDALATGYIFGSEDGLMYGLYTEAPSSKLGEAGPIGSIARLKQTQGFVKRTEDATLSFTVKRALMSATDCNLFAPSFGFTDTSITTELYFSVEVYTRADSFFHAAGGAKLTGTREEWTPEIWNYRFSRTPLWIDTDFEFGSKLIDFGDFGVCRQGFLDTKVPITHSVDLSTVSIGGKFTVQSEAFVRTNNRRGGGAADDHQLAAANAFLSDRETSGATFEFTGLEPTDDPELVPPILGIDTAPCSSGPDPDAGVIEFSAESYSVGEYPGASPVVRIVRTGGSSGAVTVTFATSDGTALAGRDYTPETGTVYFADGDSAPRTITVPVVGDELDEPDRTVNLTLSDPGGCAVLGTPATAVLTIVDDDPAPAPSIGGLDDTFGNAGKATLEFGGARSAMALQADGKIVMVGGTFADFILARFKADGGLDEDFGDRGKVTTDMVPGEQEEALGVAVQADGKIVVVGYTGVPRVPPAAKLPPNFALARYDADGKLDDTFGESGKVVAGVPGRAYAVALQSDGKIVVVGDAARDDATDFSDFVIARFDDQGNLDTSFGGGRVQTDVGKAANQARNVVLDRGGAIVVSGAVTGNSSATGFDHTDLARYDSTGHLDATFGSDGTLALTGLVVGSGLALQSDGKLVLVGSVDVTVSPAPRGSVTEFALMRLKTDGTPDDSFGDAGSVRTSISGERDAANAVALQDDGKIVVVGGTSNINTDFGIARYTSAGALDDGFGGGTGKMTVDFFHFSDVAENVAVQPDGKIVVSGAVQNNRKGYGIARINP